MAGGKESLLHLQALDAPEGVAFRLIDVRRMYHARPRTTRRSEVSSGTSAAATPTAQYLQRDWYVIAVQHRTLHIQKNVLPCALY